MSETSSGTRTSTKTCPMCGGAAPSAAFRCPHCSEEFAPPAGPVLPMGSGRESSPAGLIVIGLALGVISAVLGGLAGFGSDDSGIVIVLIGGLVSQAFLLTGVIAKGVEIGMRGR